MPRALRLTLERGTLAPASATTMVRAQPGRGRACTFVLNLKVVEAIAMSAWAFKFV